VISPANAKLKASPALFQANGLLQSGNHGFSIRNKNSRFGVAASAIH
jgi:hypothetical protein